MEDLTNKKVLIILFSTNIKVDARVKRQINFLKKLNTKEISLLYFGSEKVDFLKGINVIQTRPISRPLHRKVEKAFRIYTRTYGQMDYYYFGENDSKIGRIEKPDLIIANDIETLPLSFRIKKKFDNKPKIVADIHEYRPGQLPDNISYQVFKKPYFLHIYRNYLKKTDRIFTVSKGLCQILRSKFSVDSTVLYNTPNYIDLAPSGVEDRKIEIVYHGGARKKRKIEKLIFLIGKLNRQFVLRLFLTDSKPKNYIYELHKLANSIGKERINIYGPILPPEKIPLILNRFDIGIYLLERDRLNFKIAAPNKFFEFVQARLMNFSTPYSKDIVDLTNKFDLGVVTNTFDIDEAAEKLNSLTTEEINNYKRNADKAAKELCAEEQWKVLKKQILKTI